jgi:hypothetical protein
MRRVLLALAVCAVLAGVMFLRDRTWTSSAVFRFDPSVDVSRMLPSLEESVRSKWLLEQMLKALKLPADNDTVTQLDASITIERRGPSDVRIACRWGNRKIAHAITADLAERVRTAQILDDVLVFSGDMCVAYISARMLRQLLKDPELDRQTAQKFRDLLAQLERDERAEAEGRPFGGYRLVDIVQAASSGR